MNTHGIFVTAGASNHATADRVAGDFYATPPVATKKAVDELRKIRDTSLWNVWEPCCGAGHISEALKALNIKVAESTDLYDRGYGISGVDFLGENAMRAGSNVIFTNPPYNIFDKFLKHSLEIMDKGDILVLLGRLQILEGKTRGKIYEQNPPSYILVFRERISCWPNGVAPRESSAIAYCWAVFEKGFKGDTVVRWI